MRHMLPGAMAPLVVAATLGIADSVGHGGGAVVPRLRHPAARGQPRQHAENAQDYLFRQPILIYYPAVTLILLVLAASFLGDGLRDAFDPRQRVETK